MSDEQHHDEICRQARYDAGMLIAIATVLFAYVMFFALVFTDPPNLPANLPRKIPDLPRR